MTTDTRPKTTVVAGHGLDASAAWPRAPACSPRPGHHALRAHHRRGRRTRTRWTRRCGAATAVTFDRVDSDGCMSTNDTVLLLASGASGIVADRGGADRGGHRGLPRPGPAAARRRRGRHQGRSRSRCVGAASEDDAVEVGRSVARNNLVKTALFGNDPNWGRILAAVGTTAAAFEPDELDVAINGVWVCRAGAAAEDRSKVDLTGRDGAPSAIDLHAGDATATIWTNDLSHAYVHENSAYST